MVLTRRPAHSTNESTSESFIWVSCIYFCYKISLAIFTNSMPVSGKRCLNSLLRASASDDDSSLLLAGSSSGSRGRCGPSLGLGCRRLAAAGSPGLIAQHMLARISSNSPRNRQTWAMDGDGVRATGTSAGVPGGFLGEAALVGRVPLVADVNSRLV